MQKKNEKKKEERFRRRIQTAAASFPRVPNGHQPPYKLSVCVCECVGTIHLLWIELITFTPVGIRDFKCRSKLGG